MAYDMRYKKTPTASNLIASQELAQEQAAKLVELIRVAAAELHKLSKNPNATPDEIIAAAGAWTKRQGGIREGVFELLGVAVLGGAQLQNAARNGGGVRHTTLSEHLDHTPARFRGQEIARNGDGWMALETPSRTADVQVSGADPASFGSGHRHGAEGAARGSGADTGEVRGGASAPDRSSGDDEAAFDIEKAMNAAIGDAVGAHAHGAQAPTGTSGHQTWSDDMYKRALSAALSRGVTVDDVLDEAKRRRVSPAQVLAPYLNGGA